MLQEDVSFKIYNELLKSICNKTKKEKNTQKSAYKLRYLKIKEVKAFCTQEKEKKHDNFYIIIKGKAWKLALIAKVKEKKEKKKKKPHKKQF